MITLASSPFGALTHSPLEAVERGDSYLRALPPRRYRGGSRAQGGRLVHLPAAVPATFVWGPGALFATARFHSQAEAGTRTRGGRIGTFLRMHITREPDRGDPAGRKVRVR